MSIEVQQYLNGSNFTETAPRPPVPGEENELQSNGGQSTKSSGSHKSHKSHSSGKSIRTDLSHSPAGTPRRSNLDKTGGSLASSSQKLNDEDIEAPLGFEPEGSAANSPPYEEFNETCTPPVNYLDWAKSLDFVLQNADGVNLFRKYLTSELACSDYIDFWFACKGLKEREDESAQRTLIKMINKRYVRSENIRLKPEVRKEIQERIKTARVDQTIFDSAQSEIETLMREDWYPSFIKSDLFVQYIQNGGESPKAGSGSSSGSNSVRPLSCGPLPTLHEDSELKTEIQQPVQLTSKALLATRYTRLETRKSEISAGLYLHQPSGLKHTPPNPYHTSYAPVSAQDSELQSLSSDALTDDTMSLTDSSVDGIPAYSSVITKRHLRHQRRAMHRSAQQNRDTLLHQPLIPRTERINPKDRNIAETDPQKFAEMLIGKLNQVLKDRENNEHLNLCMNYINEGEETGMAQPVVKPAAMSGLDTLLAAAITNRDDDNCQSILDDHCNRVWDPSAQQTPSRSPGKQTPNRSKSPDRNHRRASGSLPGTLGHTKKPKKDQVSLLSFDSGVSEDRPIHHEQTKHIHHYHHHHYIAGAPGNMQQRKYIEKEAQHLSMAYETGKSRKDASKRAGSKKGSDSSSVIDSGISVVYDQPPVMSTIANPNNDKVMAWMMENEKIVQGASTNTDSERSSSHKRSHHSKSTSASPAPPRQSVTKGMKPPVQYNVSRSGSLERSGISTMISAQVAQMHHGKPSQPFAQDPNMPLLAPPHTTTQLEEAKRRLEDERNARYLSKSKSQSSNMPRQRHGIPPQAAVTSPRVPPTNPSPEMTVVAYYFGDDPVPYRTQVQGRKITLAQFKQLLTKKGNYRYHFKRPSNELEEGGVVHEEIFDDNTILPLWEGKIVGKVSKKE